MSNTRNLLIETMKSLLWQRGYDATSPNQVLDESGIGKGSLYHHFKSKKELAIAAMESRADELIKEADITFGGNDLWLDKFKHYLLAPRNGLQGCRLGRIVQDPSVSEDRELRQPLMRYFTHLHRLMTREVELAKQDGHLSSDISPTQLADIVISAVQGGFVLSQATGDNARISAVTLGAYGVLEALATR
jgi:AcrR family transcriptional regulator